MQCKMMSCRAPCMDPEFQGLGQGPLEMSWNVLLVLVTRDRGPLLLHWGISQVLLQAVSCLYLGETGEGFSAQHCREVLVFPFL